MKGGPCGGKAKVGHKALEAKPRARCRGRKGVGEGRVSAPCRHSPEPWSAFSSRGPELPRTALGHEGHCYCTHSVSEKSGCEEPKSLA